MGTKIYLAQRDEMMDYIVGRLSGSAEKVSPMRNEIIPGVVSDYILVDNSGIVLLLDKKYSEKVFRQVYNGASFVKKDLAVVVLKDEKTFFRPAFNDDYSPKRYACSRNNPRDVCNFCRDDTKEKTLFLQPEESFLIHDKCSFFSKSRVIQYFRPPSANPQIQPALETHLLTPVFLNYDYLNYPTRSKPIGRDSLRLHLFEKISENSGKVLLCKNQLCATPSDDN